MSITNLTLEDARAISNITLDGIRGAMGNNGCQRTETDGVTGSTFVSLTDEGVATYGIVYRGIPRTVRVTLEIHRSHIYFLAV